MKTTIACITPVGGHATRGLEMLVSIMHPGKPTTKFTFFECKEKEDEQKIYSLPTENGCTQDLTRQQVATYVRNFKENRVAERNSFQSFLDGLGREAVESFLEAFEEWIKNEK